jgi:DNA-binding NtrC family response regulator
LPPAVLHGTKEAVSATAASPAPIAARTAEAGRHNFVEAVEQYERSLILAALNECNWNKTQAARHLLISRRVLMYKMNHLGIEKI